MSIHYSDTVANTRLTDVVTALGAAAVLVVGTSALSGATGVLFTLSLDNPVGTVAARVLTFTGTPIDTTGAAAGTAAKAELRTGGGTVIASGLTVGVSGSGADVIMDSVGITIGRPVRLLAASITHP